MSAKEQPERCRLLRGGSPVKASLTGDIRPFGPRLRGAGCPMVRLKAAVERCQREGER